MEQYLHHLRDWKQTGDAIEKNVTLKDFQQAIAFINQVAQIAEAENHHPDICLWNWNNVKLTLSTHKVHGLTAMDFTVASKIDQLPPP